jgi:hypothetical protein
MHAVIVKVTIGDFEAAQKGLREQVVPRASQAPGFVAGYGLGLTMAATGCRWSYSSRRRLLERLRRVSARPLSFLRRSRSRASMFVRSSSTRRSTLISQQKGERRRFQRLSPWARQDSNLGPTDYEEAAAEERAGDSGRVSPAPCRFSTSITVATSPGFSGPRVAPALPTASGSGSSLSSRCT